MADELVMHVISHTHWDREWYETQQVMRVRLVDLMDRVLALLDRDRKFRAFHLDGQTIALDDYLEIRPERAARIRALIGEGRLLLGPWYVLNDEFLTSAESTVRNLRIGTAAAEGWGASMPLGYLPDQFGHIGQMPQILRGFGIDAALFGRGKQLQDGGRCEFTWQSPDGSEVLAVLMAYWYNNAQRFPEDTEEALRFTERARDQLAPICRTRHLLFMNGVDHLEAQDNLSPILAAVRQGLPEEQELRHSTLPEYFTCLREALEDKELVEHKGELREDRHRQILAGTLSTRMYLKQANDLCQRLLERVTEPLAALAAWCGAAYPHAFLDYAWKLLMQNHPHDSICGSSIDAVHLDMEPRFRQVQQVGRVLADRALEAIAANVDTTSAPEAAIPVVIVNTLPWRRTDAVEVTVDFPAESAPDAIALKDEIGAPVPYTLLSRLDTVRRDISPTELPKAVQVRRFRLAVLAREAPPCGVRVLAASPAGDGRAARGALLERGLTLRNEYLRVVVEPNGSLTVTDLVAGATYSGLNVFEDGGDVGDEYTYIAPAPDRVITTLGWAPTIQVIEDGPARASIEIAGDLPLPASSDATGRSQQNVFCSIRSVVSLSADVPRVEIQTTVTNWAEDHRLRVVFPTDIPAKTVTSEGHFDFVERPLQPPAEWPNPATTQPQQGFVALGDGHKGLCIVNEGLPEFEALDDGRGTIALTLMRCVGVLSGGGDCTGSDPTPGAQMLGQFTFRYGIVPYAGALVGSEAHRQAHQQRVPLQSVQTTRHEGRIAPRVPLLSLEPEALVPTATYRAADGGTVVRFFNPTDSTVEGALRAGAGLAEAHLVDLRDRPTEALTVSDGGTVSLEVRPRAIVSVLLKTACEGESA